MLKIKNVLGAMAVAGLLGGVMTAAPEAQAGANTCKRVKFRFSNGHPDGRDIKVVKVEHLSAHDKKWRTEDVADTTCAPGATCTTNGDNLAGVEARDIEKVRFHYKVKGPDGNWSSTIEGGRRTVSGDQECRADKVYGTFNITG